MKFIMAQIAESKILGEFINLQYIEADTLKKAKLQYGKINKLSKWFVRCLADKGGDYWYVNYSKGSKYFDECIRLIKENDKDEYRFFHERQTINFNYDSMPKEDNNITYISNPYANPYLISK